MRLHDDIDHITLGWVKPEIDETLRQARHALEAYVESPGDAAPMLDCVQLLHQVQGTLKIVELYGAAMLAEEMELIAQALHKGAVGDRDEAFTVLMRGIVQLPDYLERLQGGHKDIPLVLLPLLNELRAARGEKEASESLLFSPDVDRPLPGDARGPLAPMADDVLRRQAESLRAQYQTALLRWLKDDENPATISALVTVCDRLVDSVHYEPLRRLFWVAGGTLEALHARAFQPSNVLKQALARVEREIKRLADGGERAFRNDPPLELTRQLLYFVAHAPTDHGRLGEIREVFGLQRYVPSEAELAHARGSMAGHNRELLDTVSAAIKEDLLRVKDALDLHLRSERPEGGDLGEQIEVLRRVADTLGMLGLVAPRRVVEEQRDAVQEIVSGMRSSDESCLLDIAGALLYVEASLDDQVARLGQAGLELQPGPGAPLPSTEAQRVLDALVKEAVGNFAMMRQCFVAYVETGWDADQLAEAPRLLEEVRGALRILELERAPGLVEAIEAFTRAELIAHRRVPDPQQLDTLADALTGLECYVEAVGSHRGQREQYLDVAQAGLETLGYWPLPVEGVAAVAEAADTSAAAAQPPTAMPEVSAEAAASAGPMAGDRPTPQPEPLVPDVSDPGVPSLDEVAVPSVPDETELAVIAEAGATPASEPPPPERAPLVVEVPATAGVAGSFGFEGAGEDIDDEIREVFLEELQEEIANLDELIPAWRAHPEGLDRLRSIRRVFHTLKGSGRLVGALTLGEFAWKIENLLNRVLDASRPATPAVIALVEQARQLLPLMRASMQGMGPVQADIEGLKAIADRLAGGEEVAVPADVAVAAASAGEAIPEPAAPTGESFSPTEAVAVTVAVGGAREVVAIDAVLLDILKAEVAGHLHTIDAWLAGEGRRLGAASDALMRAVHTANGAFAMTEVPLITDVTAPLESYIKRLIAHAIAPDEQGVALIAEAAEAIRGVIAELDRPAPVLADLGDLPLRLAAMRDTLSEPSRPTLPMSPEIDSGEDDAALVPGVVDLDALDADVLDAMILGGEAPVAPGAAFNVVDAPAPIADLPPEEIPAAAEAMRWSDAEVAAADAFIAALSTEITQSPVGFDEAAETPAKSAPAIGFADYTAEEAAELAALFAAEAEAEALEAHLQAGGAQAERSESAAPEAVEPEAVEPEVVEPEVVELEAVEPEAVEPEAVEPEAVEPEVVELEVVELEVVEPEAVVPEAVEPEVVEPEVVEPEVVEPEVVEPEVVEPEVVEPEVVEPEVVEPDVVEPEVVEPEVVEPDVVEPEAVEPEAVEPEAVEPDVVEPEVVDEPEAIELVEFADDPDPDLPLDMADLDPELLDIFLEESSDLLDHSDGLLAQLREMPSERELVVELQRDLHTLKGGARMAGIHAVGELGHVMESLLEAVAESRRELDGDGVRLLERGFDRLHGMVMRVGARRALAVPSTLIAEVDALLSGQPAKSAGPAAEARPAQPLPPLSAPLRTDDLPEDDDAGGMRAPQEQVRIRADLLDRLVNSAGEVAIYRARLEQQLGAFRGNLGEFEQTTGRLREQLRKLEIETEAQIIARYQREKDEADETFDPLELDRFSTLQQLSRALAESAADLVSIQGVFDDLTRQYETLLLQQSRVSSDLQEGLMRTRMVPFDALVPRLRRVLRQAASETGKQVQIKVDGAQGEMDRNVLERMTAPLEHMLRNAVAHGLEAPAERKRAGKPEEGQVRIAVSREGSEVVIAVSDDGRGLDAGAIRKKAIERGLLKPDAEIAEQELYGFILETGFSTAESVSRLAGRGVGMDVVHNEIRQLGGSLQIRSQAGQGSEFIIRLPFTLAVTQAVFVKVGETHFAVPIASVAGVGRIARAELAVGSESGHARYRYAGEDYAVHDLARLLGLGATRAQDSLQVPLLLVRSGDVRIAISVDQVQASREIVVKPVGPQVNSIPGVFGATVMGDGSVVVLLDIAPLVRRQAAVGPIAPMAEAAEVRRVPLVMVVDDSITMRKVTGRVLERHHLEVVTAKDGIDAIEKMAERVPDLMLLDIEMPRMDGYELATHMRNDARLREVPIVMITSRTGEKHRQRAFEIGVNRYLGKPYQEPELMRNVLDLIGQGRGE